MKRFIYKKKSHSALSCIVCICVLLLAAGIFIRGFTSLSESTVSRQRDTLESALNRCITSCYVTEGMYPESLDYIKANYGLVYNEDIFYVDYRVSGSNIPPEVTIIEKEVQQ